MTEQQLRELYASITVDPHAEQRIVALGHRPPASPRHRTYLAITAAAALVVALAVAVGVRDWSGAGQGLPQGSVSPAAPWPTPDIVNGRLAAPFAYGDGQTRFDPPDPSYRPPVSLSQAMTAAAKVGLTAFPCDGRQLQSYLALLAGHQPVWVLLYAQVPSQPLGGAGRDAGSLNDPSGATATVPPSRASPTTYIEDKYWTVDATTGTVQSVTVEMPDSSVQPAATADPAGKHAPRTH